MFPVGKSTGLLQAVREAEDDVYVLVLAARSLPNLRTHILRYVAVALLAYVEATEELASNFFRLNKDQLSDTRSQGLRKAKKSFASARNKDQIEKRLRNKVRNLVSAHRHQQTVQSMDQTHDALKDPEFACLFHTARSLVDEMEAIPVWTWAHSTPNGIKCMRGSKRSAWRPDPPNPDGFDVRYADGSGSFDYVQEHEFTYAAVHEAHGAELDWPATLLDEPRQIIIGAAIPLKMT